MNWRYYGVQEPKMQDIPQPPKYKVVWGKDTVHKKYPTLPDSDVLDRGVAFKTHFAIDFGGLDNLFQTVAAFQPGR